MIRRNESCEVLFRKLAPVELLNVILIRTFFRIFVFNENIYTCLISIFTFKKRMNCPKNIQSLNLVHFECIIYLHIVIQQWSKQRSNDLLITFHSSRVRKFKAWFGERRIQKLKSLLIPPLESRISKMFNCSTILVFIVRHSIHIFINPQINCKIIYKY